MPRTKDTRVNTYVNKVFCLICDPTGKAELPGSEYDPNMEPGERTRIIQAHLLHTHKYKWDGISGRDKKRSETGHLHGEGWHSTTAKTVLTSPSGNPFLQISVSDTWENAK